MVVLIDGASHGTETVVTVGHHIGHRKFRKPAGLCRLDYTHIGYVMGDKAVKAYVHDLSLRSSVMGHEDLIGHGFLSRFRIRPLRLFGLPVFKIKS